MLWYNTLNRIRFSWNWDFLNKSRCKFICRRRHCRCWIYVPELFTEGRMEQKDIQADEKRNNEQETTVGFYLGEMKRIKHDLLSQMAGATLFTHKLLKIIYLADYRYWTIIGFSLFSPNSSDWLVINFVCYNTCAFWVCGTMGIPQYAYHLPNYVGLQN